MGEIKRRINSIDIFRYICAVMIIAIHTTPFSDINEQMGYVFSQIVPRIAVPFFFAVSGYFYMSKLENGNNCFFKYLRRLLGTYFIWSFFYYIIDYMTWGRSENFIYFIKQCIYRFVITGSHYHFWFFPALIFSICISTLLFKIKCKNILIPLSIGLYMVGCLGCSYYGIGIKIPVIQDLINSSYFEIVRRVMLMGFPFFICGYLVYKIQYNFLTGGGEQKYKFGMDWDYSCSYLLNGNIYCAKTKMGRQYYNNIWFIFFGYYYSLAAN